MCEWVLIRAADERLASLVGSADAADGDEEVEQLSFPINPEDIESVKKQCRDVLRWPVLEEYDFRNDTCVRRRY